jgi:hypothetical protein
MKLSKEQMTVVKTVNSTLLTVSENEKSLSKRLEEMAKHVNEQDGEIKRMFTSYSLLWTINEHSIQLSRAIEECRREYEILIDAVLNIQKGIIQPQLITPAHILEQLKSTHAEMPSDLTLPIPTSVAYQHLVLRIVSIDVFVTCHFLVCYSPTTDNVM